MVDREKEIINSTRDPRDKNRESISDFVHPSERREKLFAVQNYHLYDDGAKNEILHAYVNYAMVTYIYKMELRVDIS